MALQESVTESINHLRAQLSQRIANSDRLAAMLGQDEIADLPCPSIVI